MRKRKLEVLTNQILFQNNIIRVSKEHDGISYYEIGSEITVDIIEAVSILLRIKNINNDSFWDLEIPKTSTLTINPENCLFWLSGGKEEWFKNDNYKLSWIDSCSLFREFFEKDIEIMLNNSKTFKDIKNYIIKNLNISIMYDFALRKGIA